MPVLLSSRYYGLPVYDAADAEGRLHATVAIRPTTPPPPGAAEFHHRVVGLEDLEYLAWRYYGTSAGWWRIAEANPLLFPLDWSPGMTVTVPSAGDVGHVERTRRF